jgi:hypothetical protein
MMFKVLHDIQTGEITKIDLEGDELEEFKTKEAAAKKVADKVAQEFADQQAAKAELLTKLGITAEEAKLLLG